MSAGNVRTISANAIGLLRSEAHGAIGRGFTLALLLTVAFSVVAALAPLIFSEVIDAFATQPSSIATSPLALTAAYILAVCLSRTSAELRVLAGSLASKQLQRRITTRLFDHLLSLPMTFHSERQSGAIAQALNNGLAGYQLLVHHCLFTIFPIVIELILVAVVLLSLHHAEYFLILLVAAAAHIVVYVRGAPSMVEPARAGAAADVAAQAKLVDALLNTEAIKHLDVQEKIVRRHDEVMAAMEGHWRRFFFNRTWVSLATTLIFSVSLAASLLMAAREVLDGTMTVGELAMIHIYLVRFAQPLELLGQALRDLAHAVASLEKLMELFGEPGEPAPRAATSAASWRGHIELQKISFCYEASRTTLHNVSCSIDAGQTVALVGPSGSGKSTLARLLLGLYRPSSGAILLDGVPLNAWSVPEVRRLIALVPQDTVLFDDTLAYNIALAAPGCTPADIEHAVHVADLTEVIDRLPHGLQTHVGERGLKLSPGERQRVAIARAVIKQPRAYILDEATSSLDGPTERRILRRLREASAGCTVVHIAHRLRAIMGADEIVVLDAGRIVEQGRHEQLLAAGGLYRQLWSAQATGAVMTASDLDAI